MIDWEDNELIEYDEEEAGAYSAFNSFQVSSLPRIFFAALLNYLMQEENYGCDFETEMDEGLWILRFTVPSADEEVTAQVVVEARKMDKEYGEKKPVLFVGFSRESGDRVVFGKFVRKAIQSEILGPYIDIPEGSEEEEN